VRLARRLAAALGPGDLLVLTGELGAGKTFFARALCRARGLPVEVRVTSPSFALVQEYRLASWRPGAAPVVHADLYRIDGDDQVRRLGLRERRDEALLVIEWGDRYISELGGHALSLRLSWAAAGRLAELSATDGPRSELFHRAVEAVGLPPVA